MISCLHEQFYCVRNDEPQTLMLMRCVDRTV